MNGLNEQQLASLSAYGFDPELLAHWQAEVAAGRLSKAGNAVTSDLLAPPPGTIQKLPGSSTKAHRELDRIGREAIAGNQVGVVLLNGGMATRFGGGVKGLVPVLGESRSFIALCIEDVLRTQRACGGRVRVYLMNSFATDVATRQHLAQHDYFGLDPAQIHHFTQSTSLRLDKRGELFRFENGDVSPYGPGHGDFAEAVRRVALPTFLAGGGRYLLVRNVDNVGARIDPAILGHHRRSGDEMTVELAPKWPEDRGGSPFFYEGRTQLIEQVRQPEGLDPEIVDVFNTNTFTFTATALDRQFDLAYYYVEKDVGGRTAVQIEHLIGELTAHLSTSFLQVRRSGCDSRFLPVKTPDDLDAARDEIAEMYDGAPQ